MGDHVSLSVVVDTRRSFSDASDFAQHLAANMPSFTPVDAGVVSIPYRAPVGYQPVWSARVGETSLRCGTSKKEALFDRSLCVPAR